MGPRALSALRRARRRPTAPSSRAVRPTRSWPKRVASSTWASRVPARRLWWRWTRKLPRRASLRRTPRSSTISAARCAATAIFPRALPSFPTAAPRRPASSASSCSRRSRAPRRVSSLRPNRGCSSCPSWTTLRGRRSSREVRRATMRSRTRRSPRTRFRLRRARARLSPRTRTRRRIWAAPSIGRRSWPSRREGFPALRASACSPRRTLYRRDSARGWPMPASAGSPARRTPKRCSGGCGAPRCRSSCRYPMRSWKGRSIFSAPTTRSLRALVRSWWTIRPAVRTARRRKRCAPSTSCRRNATPMHCCGRAASRWSCASRASSARIRRGTCKP